MEEFLKELTELSLKHKIVIAGSGTYSCVNTCDCKSDLKGKYIIAECGDESHIEWSDNVTS